MTRAGVQSFRLTAVSRACIVATISPLFYFRVIIFSTSTNIPLRKISILDTRENTRNGIIGQTSVRIKDIFQHTLNAL